MTPVKGLRVVALLDGRPGHEKQTMGIIHGLERRCPVDLVQIKVDRFSLRREIIQTCRLFLPAKRFGTTLPQPATADLLIGTGSRTHLPMLLYKKRYGIPAVTCMSPARYLQPLFDLCFVPEHDGRSEKANIVVTTGAPNCSFDKKRHEAGCGLILLGGVDEKSHRWQDSRIVGMVEKIVSDGRAVSWIVSSSPRTPQETIAQLEKLLKKYDNLRFFDYKDTPAGWIEEQYDRNARVWVTADSISMIYEALSAGCQVGLLPVEWRQKNSKFRRNENILVDKKLVTPFAEYERSDAVVRIPRKLNEAERCADRILQRWWPENLP